MSFLLLLLILAIGGRWACSHLCPLGLIQEILFRLPFFKKCTELPFDKQLRKIKYIGFFLLVILIPLVFLPNRAEWEQGFLVLKLFGFTTVFILSLFIFRPFCKYFCPFGVFLGFFNRISPYRYAVEENCNQCGLCKRNCRMGIAPYENPNSMECIRCGECLSKCPKKVLQMKRSEGKRI